MKTVSHRVKLLVYFSNVFALASCGQKSAQSNLDVTISSADSPDSAQVPAGIYDNAVGSPLLSLIQSARQTLDIEIYQMRSEDVQKAIVEAAERNVAVRIVAETNSVGDRCGTFSAYSAEQKLCVGGEQILKLVEKGKIHFRPFNKSLCGGEDDKCFQHGKLAIVDKHVALMSTGNFNDSSLCTDRAKKCNRDYSVVTYDKDVLRTLNHVFDSDFDGKPYDLKEALEIPGGDKITVSPNSQINLIEFIDSAKKSLYVQNQYLKEPEINAALIRAAERGVKVKVTLSSLCSFGFPSDRSLEPVRPTFESFDKAGIELRMFTQFNLIQNKPGYMHAKVIMVDNTYAWVGSINGSSTSMSKNREFGLFVGKSPSLSLLADTLRSDHDSRENETWQDNVKCTKEASALRGSGDRTESGEDQ